MFSNWNPQTQVDNMQYLKVYFVCFLSLVMKNAIFFLCIKWQENNIKVRACKSDKHKQWFFLKKLQFCNNLIIVMSFQTCMHIFFLLQNTK